MVADQKIAAMAIWLMYVVTFFLVVVDTEKPSLSARSSGWKLGIAVCYVFSLGGGYRSLFYWESFWRT